MYGKLTAYALTALIAIIGASILGHLAQTELAKDNPGLSPVACILLMLLAVLTINIFTQLEDHQ